MTTLPADVAENLVHRVNVGDSLTRTAARHPGRTAVVDGGRRWTYRELNTWVNRLAHGLAGRGYARGDALALASGNSAEFLATYYACAKLGLVCVPINLGWRTDEVVYVLQDSGARGLVVESQLVATLAPAVQKSPAVTDVIVAPGTGVEVAEGLLLDEVLADSSAEPEVVVGDRDPITYLYTSGTTSAPKGVIGNHTAIYLESLTMAFEARFAEDDRFAAMLPMFHTAQLNTHCTPAIMVGAAIHVLRAFDPAGLLALIESERITQIFGLPMMYRAMLDHPDVATRDLSSLRRACYAMAPMPEAQVRRAIETLGCDFYLLFGQTEMSPTTTLFRPEHQLTHPGAVGTPVVNVQLAIMGPDGELLPDGAEGEIVYRGPAHHDRLSAQPRGHRAGLRPRLVPLRRRRAGRRRRRPLVHRPLQGRHQDRRRERGVARGRAGRSTPPTRASGRSPCSVCRTSGGARRSRPSSSRRRGRRSIPMPWSATSAAASTATSSRSR